VVQLSTLGCGASLMSKLKAIIIAASASLATELVAAACLMHVGGDGPGDIVGWIGLVLAYPTMLVERHLGGLSSFVFIFLGFLQFFIIYAVVIFTWRYWRYGRTAA
jgi:hypothetical protein